MAKKKTDLGQLLGDTPKPFDPDNKFAAVLTDYWMDRDTDYRPMSRPDANIRMSSAGDCARLLSLTMVIPPEDREPMSRGGRYVTTQGTEMHTLWGKAMKWKYGDRALLEPAVSIKRGRLLLSGHSDCLLEATAKDPVKRLLELKSTGAFKFTMAIGAGWASKEPGPAYTAVVQAALNAYAHGADTATVVYLPMGSVSRSAIQKAKLPALVQEGVSWTYSREEYEPIAERELARMERIVDLVLGGRVLAPRIVGHPENNEIPHDAEIVDPDTGKWQSEGGAGTWWRCSYCLMREACIEAGPGTPVIDQGLL